MAISDWPLSERPREKLLQRGATALSDAELLAIFLRTGIPGRSAVDLARDLLLEAGGLRRLLEMTPQEFCSRPGLGPAKLALLQATLEMGRRHLYEKLEKGDALDSPALVRDYLRRRLRHQPREVFCALFLDNRHCVLACEELFHGTIDSASVYPREVVKRALHWNAAAMIFRHYILCKKRSIDFYIKYQLVTAINK